MGSELIRRGLTLPNHIWSAEANINNPKIVQKIHGEYVDAGADYITANTFRTTPRSYLKTGVGDEKSLHMAKDSLFKAVKIAKGVAGSSVKVIGSIAPMEDCYAPKLFPNKDVAVAEFTQLGKWLSEVGIDILLLETMNSLAETEAALIGIDKFSIPVWVSFVLKDSDNLLSGDSIAQTIEIIKRYSVECILINCNPLDRTVMAVEKLVDNWTGNWGAYPNLGIGEPSPDGNIQHYEEMNKFVSTMEKIIEKQPFVLGACCGSSPRHIAELIRLRNESHILPYIL